MHSVEDYIASFKENSIKITPQRLAIFNVLNENTSHPSAEDIFKDVLAIHPNTSFATVYNTLDRLYELNLILKLNIEGEKSHYDPNIKQHHHFLCSKCKKIFDIWDEYSVIPSQEVNNHYKINNYQINFYGTCMTCSQ